MVEFGAALRKAREASGISLDEIYERTRIAIKHLRAIEAGDFPSVPQTYVRAFIREYARIVGLDENDIVAAYNDVAEREKGIPKPPDAIDAAHILPHLDDTIEIIVPGTVVPRHVEVQGKAEVEESASFTPPVRKSTSVSDISEPAIEIRTTAKKEPPSLSSAERPGLAGQHPDTVSAAGIPASPTIAPASSVSTSTAPDASRLPPPGAPPEAATPVPPAPPVLPSTTASSPATPAPDAPSQKKSLRSEILDKFTRSETRPPSSGPEQKPRRSVYAAKPPHEETRRTAPAPLPKPPAPKKKPEARVNREEKRILVIGSIAVLILIVCVYAFFHFQTQERATDSMVDSTGLKASLDAGKFIDSTQHAVTEVLPLPADTTKTVIVAPETVDPRQKSRAKDDSLILEGFSSAPVWFSVRMDTMRTERGNMSTNDHRVWKAHDRFMITLGDAGAITFFLNGKELSPLGEEGAVIKNVTISRQNLNPGN